MSKRRALVGNILHKHAKRIKTYVEALVEGATPRTPMATQASHERVVPQQAIYRRPSLSALKTTTITVAI